MKNGHEAQPKARLIVERQERIASSGERLKIAAVRLQGCKTLDEEVKFRTELAYEFYYGSELHTIEEQSSIKAGLKAEILELLHA